MFREIGLFLLHCNFHVFCCSQFLIVVRFVWKWRGDLVKWGMMGFFFFFFGVHANCPNFVPLKRKKEKEIKKKETKKGGYESIYQIKRKVKKKWEKGVDCIAAVIDRHAKSALIKAATEATCTGPCSALLPSNYNTHQKEGRETTLPLVVLARNPTPEKEREKERE